MMNMSLLSIKLDKNKCFSMKQSKSMILIHRKTQNLGARWNMSKIEKQVHLNNVTYPWCISLALHARKCPWSILVRSQVPSFHVIIHCNSLKRIYSPCYWERAELTLGQIAPWTWSLYFEFLLLITSTNSVARVEEAVTFTSLLLNPLA